MITYTIVRQEIYRQNTNKPGYVVRMLISPSIDLEEARYSKQDINKINLFDFYNKERKWPIKVWGPTFDELFSIMKNDKRHIQINESMLNDLVNDINIDPVALVEKYLVSDLGYSSNDDWPIKVSWHKVDLTGEYYYDIDCRALFSLIKQIMICEDQLYPQGKGRRKILDEFKKF